MSSCLLSPNAMNYRTTLVDDASSHTTSKRSAYLLTCAAAVGCATVAFATFSSVNFNTQRGIDNGLQLHVTRAATSFVPGVKLAPVATEVVCLSRLVSRLFGNCLLAVGLITRLSAPHDGKADQWLTNDAAFCDHTWQGWFPLLRRRISRKHSKAMLPAVKETGLSPAASQQRADHA